MVDWQKCENLCDLKTNFAAKLILKHKGSKNTLAAVVGHVPSTNGSDKRRQDTITTLCDQLATDDTLPTWIIGGDFNLPEDLAKFYCYRYLECRVPCIARSGQVMDDARKADFAITRGIHLPEVRSWVGWSQGNCASDAHNMVPVVGTFRSAAISSDRSHVTASAPWEFQQ